MSEDLFRFAFLFAVPVVAIIGGVTMGIIRTLGQQRMAELARRERIAAIERGIDLDKLPPVMGPGGYDDYSFGDGRLRRAHGLLIAGSILIAVGIGLLVLLKSVEPEKSHWMLGLLPMLVGGALLASCAVIWPKKAR